MSSDTPPGPPAHWQRFATSEIDEAYDFFRQSFTDFQARTSTPGIERCVLSAAGAQLGEVGMVRMRYTAGSQFHTAPSGDLNINLILSGRVRLDDGRDSYAVPQHGVVLLSPDRPVDLLFSDVEAMTVRLPRSLIEELAHQTTGIEPADLRFDGCRPVSPPMARYWRQTVSYVMGSVLTDPDLSTSPLIVGQARRLLAAAALATFSTNAHDGQDRDPHDVAPATLRRAVGYLEEHADRDVTVAQIAAAAGCSVRAVQYAFRRYRDTTPLQYARAVRLERAHRDLRAADPTTGTTVAAIATRWGFANPGRFSIDYRIAYGQSPSSTLRT
jgi:AraC-like DNA-binding protein